MFSRAKVGSTIAYGIATSELHVQGQASGSKCSTISCAVAVDSVFYGLRGIKRSGAPAWETESPSHASVNPFHSDVTEGAAAWVLDRLDALRNVVGRFVDHKRETG